MVYGCKDPEQQFEKAATPGFCYVLNFWIRNFSTPSPTQYPGYVKNGS
jgi:hypothetical protein